MIIDLEHLESCSIVRDYNAINAGQLRKQKLSTYLTSIFLHLRFKNSAKPIAIPFFNADQGTGEDRESLAIKADKWKQIVSKTLPITLREAYS